MTLPLPGDADTVIAADTARAVRRDGRPNREEWRALFLISWCAEAKNKYHFWKCSYWDPCCYCEDLG